MASSIRAISTTSSLLRSSSHAWTEVSMGGISPKGARRTSRFRCRIPGGFASHSPSAIIRSRSVEGWTAPKSRQTGSLAFASGLARSSSPRRRLRDGPEGDGGGLRFPTRPSPAPSVASAGGFDPANAIRYLVGGTGCGSASRQR